MSRLKTIGPRVTGINTSRLQSTPASTTDSWRTGLTTTERGYGWKWQQARDKFLKAHPLCAYCARAGYITAATVVDHIIPHKGDQTLFWDVNNWQPLCKPCHDSIKKAEENKDSKY